MKVLLKKKLADESTKKQDLQTRLQHLQNDLIMVTLHAQPKALPSSPGGFLLDYFYAVYLVG